MNQVESVDAPTYGQGLPKAGTTAEAETIAAALRILESRMRAPGRQFLHPKDTKDYMMLRAEKHKDVEVFSILWLDSGHRFIAFEDIAKGTLTQTSVYPREVLKSALYYHAAACILTHNHPSGRTNPSSSDLALTAHLKRTLGMIEVKLLDHVITGGAKARSLAEEGQM